MKVIYGPNSPPEKYPHEYPADYSINEVTKFDIQCGKCGSADCELMIDSVQFEDGHNRTSILCKHCKQEEVICNIGDGSG